MFGFYAWKEMDIIFTCYFGLACFINALLDLVRFLSVLVNNHKPFFSGQAGFKYNFNNALGIMIPLIQFTAALVAWLIYRDATENDDWQTAEGGQPGASGVGNRQFNETTSLTTAQMGPGHPNNRTFTPFAGRGHTLGTAPAGTAPETP